MKHLTQEEIVLCYYDDCENSGHLAECEQCRAELRRVAQVLDQVAAYEVPEPDAAYESRVWERLSWRLRGEKKRARRNEWMRWATAAAVVIVAFLAGMLWNRNNVETGFSPSPTAGLKPGATSVPVKTQEQQQQVVRDRILFVVVSDHFDESERILVELTNLEVDDDTDISAESERAKALLASNRLYRQTAEERGQETVATLLDELEPILLQIAHTPSEAGAEELRAMQKRVAAKGLVMKLRVVRSDVRKASAAQAQQPNV